jgi:hypothetical protein
VSPPTLAANCPVSDRIGGPSSKKPRRVGTADSARFQSVSQEDLQEKVIKDSYEEELSNDSGRIRVVVPIDKDFDRNAYGRYSIESSQPSQISQPSYSSHPSEPSQPSQAFTATDSQSGVLSQSSQPQFRTPKPVRSPFLWDEDLPAVIPDSQFLPGSSPFKPTETPTSRAESKSSTRPNTEETSLRTPFHETSSGNSQASTDTREESLPNSERPSSHSGHLLADTSGEKSSHCESSGSYLPSNIVPKSVFTEASQPSQLSRSQPAQSSASDKASIDPNSQQEISGHQISSQIPPSLESLPSPVRRQSTWSEEAQLSLTQEQSEVPESQIVSQIVEDSSLQFQTQLPLPSVYQDTGSQGIEDRITHR